MWKHAYILYMYLKNGWGDQMDEMDQYKNGPPGSRLLARATYY